MLCPLALMCPDEDDEDDELECDEEDDDQCELPDISAS